jgi:hypothetical protein
MDFLDEQCAELVPYALSASPAAAHPFPVGTDWAEPDLEAAAAALRSVYDDLGEARRKAWLGRIAVTRLCGPKAAARALRKRLGDSPFGLREAQDRHRLGAAR